MNQSYTVFVLENTVNGRTFVGATADLDHTVRLENGQISRKRSSAYTRQYRDGGEWLVRIIVEDFRRFEALQIVRQLTSASRGKRGSPNLQRRMTALADSLQRGKYPCQICVQNQ